MRGIRLSALLCATAAGGALLAGCGHAGRVRSRRPDRRRRRRERVRERDRADRRQVRRRDRDREQPEHRPAHASRPARASPRRSSAAQLVVQNGVGYDTYMNKIESASPNSSRKVIDVQTLLGLPGLHPESPPLVHAARRCRPSRARWSRTSPRCSRRTPRTSRANARRFDASLDAVARGAARRSPPRYPGTPVATTEPVGDYMLQAAGLDNADAVQRCRPTS